MAGRSTGELKRLLLEGIVIVAAGEETNTPRSDGGTWKRVVLAPGVELHLESSSDRLSKQEIESIIKELRQHL